jgi:HD-like signal output (HDOD) protein
MKDEKISELLKRIESGYSLPSLSPVALKLVELASDERCSADDLVRLIEKDPPLVVRLLKLANSAFFGSVHHITRLNQAVIKIGFHRLRIMALSISLRDTFPMGRVGPLDYEKFWRTSLYRAIIAKHLADYTKNTNPEDAFISGLILEMGLLIFFDLFIKGKDEEVTLELEPFKDLLAWEKDRYGLDHRQVGETAMRHWNFPEGVVLCQKIYLHRAESEDIPPIAKCELARSLSGILFMKDMEFSSIYREAEKILGIGRDTINDILVDTFQQVEEIAENLTMELDREKDLLLIMEKANVALSEISEKISSKVPGLEQPLPSLDSISEGDEIVTHTLQAVVHEIRNPLLAVGGFAKKLSASMDPLSKGGKYVQIILEEARRLENVLSEMTKKETETVVSQPKN